MARLRHLARDYEGLAETLVALHSVALAMLVAHRLITIMIRSA
jgi:hypothetical protein